MNVQTDVGHIVDVLASHKPDNLANLAFGIIAGYPGKSGRTEFWRSTGQGTAAVRPVSPASELLPSGP